MAAGTAQTPRWYRRWRIWITDKSKGVNELLAALGEPLMRYATIYLALATGIPYIKFAPAYTACQGIVISVPEFVILGALGVAEGACKEEHNKKWGIALYGICALLALIMVATFVDIFIYQFPDIAVKSLNFARCIVAVGFSITLGKLDQDTTSGDQAAQPAQAQPPAPPAIDLTPIHQAMETLTTQVEQLADTQEQRATEHTTLAGEVKSLQANIHLSLHQQITESYESLAERLASELATPLQGVQELRENVTALQTHIATLAAHKNDTRDDTKTNTEERTETDTLEETGEHTNNITLLSSRRAQKRTPERTKTHTANSSDKASRAMRYIRKNPHIAPTELAQKAQISVTYARKLLAQKEA